MDTVPKNIMQTWKTSNVPDKWKLGQASIVSWNLGWNYQLMSDDDNLKFMEIYFPQYVDRYKKLPYPIMKADTIRYAWLYVNGGVYIDLDYCAHESFDLLLDSIDQNNDIFLRWAGTGPSNDFMMSKPRHDFWLKCLEDIFSGDKPMQCVINKHLCILEWTGPGVVGRSINKYTNLKWQYVSTKLFPKCTLCRTPNNKGILFSHLEGDSWVDPRMKVIKDMACNVYTNPYAIQISILLILILILMIILIR